MPQTIASILVSYGYTQTAALVIAYVIVIAATVAYGDQQRKKANQKSKDAYNNSLEDRLVMTATANGARSRVYGRVRNVDGVIFKGTHGTYSEYYTLVVSLAAHEVDAIEQIYFNDVPITLDGSGYVLTAPWSGARPSNAQQSITITGGAGSATLAHTPIGAVTCTIIQNPTSTEANSFSATASMAGLVATVTGLGFDGTATLDYQWSEDRLPARVRMYLGGASQNLYSDLNALVGAQVDATDRFAGDATLICTFLYDQDAFPTGVPNITATVRGAKCYDPRTGTTAWTENPAIIARDWALYQYGGGASSSEIVEAAFLAAANACDVSTVFTKDDASTETRPLFQCGITCPLDANPTDALGEMVEAMAGQWGWAGGKLTVRAGVYRAPVATITEDWVSDAEAIRIVPQTATVDLVNVMRPIFADANQAYVPTSAAPVRYTAAITADGRELPRELDMRAVTHAVHAQHVCGVLMREGREGLSLSLPCNYRAWQLEVFDVVALTLPRFGWSAKEFEVLGWSFSLQQGVILTLREVAAVVYDIDASFDTLDYATNTNLPDPSVVEQITGVSVTSGASGQVDKSVLVRTVVSWTAATGQAVRESGKIEVQFTPAGATLPTGNWPAVEVEGNATSAAIAGLRQNIHYLFRVRARNTIGVRGKWSLLVTTQMAGVPQVDTDGLAPNAATDPPQFGFASSGSHGHSVINVGSAASTVTALSYTNTSADTVQVEVTGSVNGRLSTSGSAVGLAWFTLECDRSTGTDSAITIGNVETSAVMKNYAGMALESVAPGITATFNLYAWATITSGVGTATNTWELAALRITPVKK